MKEVQRCIYCGGEIKVVNKKHKIRLPNESLKEVYCCSNECYKETKNFMSEEKKMRNYLFAVLAVCVVINLILLSFFKDSKVIYFPIAIMGLVLSIWPYIFIRYRSYARSGIVNTIARLKKAGFVLTALSIVFIIFA